MKNSLLEYYVLDIKCHNVLTYVCLRKTNFKKNNTWHRDHPTVTFQILVCIFDPVYIWDRSEFVTRVVECFLIPKFRGGAQNSDQILRRGY